MAKVLRLQSGVFYPGLSVVWEGIISNPSTTAAPSSTAKLAVSVGGQKAKEVITSIPSLNPGQSFPIKITLPIFASEITTKGWGEASIQFTDPNGKVFFSDSSPSNLFEVADSLPKFSLGDVVYVQQWNVSTGFIPWYSQINGPASVDNDGLLAYPKSTSGAGEYFYYLSWAPNPGQGTNTWSYPEPVKESVLSLVPGGNLSNPFPIEWLEQKWAGLVQ